MKADDCLFGTASVERKTKRDVARQMDCFTDLIDADADTQRAIATSLSEDSRAAPSEVAQIAAAAGSAAGTAAILQVR